MSTNPESTAKGSLQDFKYLNEEKTHWTEKLVSNNIIAFISNRTKTMV